MRFWAYFTAKIVVAGVVMWGVLGVVDSLFPDIDPSLTAREAQFLKPGYRAAPRNRVEAIVPAPDILTEEIPPTPTGGPLKKADQPLDARLLPLRHTGQVLAM